uniref:helix-turn-helix domain-containing protein n=1 Tax=Hymenobacter sp. IS2118 TaxID=1505605 RepID=UPI00190F9A77
MAVSRSPEALVRTALGLSQAQLARFLGVAAPVLAHYEAGRRLPPAAVAERLLPLARLLPPPLGSGLPETVLPAPDPDPDAVVWWLALPAGTSAGVPEPVRRRVRDCRLLALGLHQQLARLQGRATGLAHRRRGL